jgi:hypothetical protein
MVSIIAAPFWGMAADRTRSAGRTFVLCMTVGAFLWALIPVSLRITPGSLSIVYPVLLLGCFFRSPNTRAKSLAQIARIQIIGGLGSGLWIGAVIRYVYLLAPKGLNSTALTTYSAVSAVSVIIGSPLGGILIGNIGIVSFYRVICGLLVFALLFLCGTLRAGVKVLNKPLPFLQDEPTYLALKGRGMLVLKSGWTRV